MYNTSYTFSRIFICSAYATFDCEFAREKPVLRILHSDSVEASVNKSHANRNSALKFNFDVSASENEGPVRTLWHGLKSIKRKLEKILQKLTSSAASHIKRYSISLFQRNQDKDFSIPNRY